MKGVMFTEFLEWVEREWSPEMADDLLDSAALPSGGAYTAVGTYDHTEMLTLGTLLAQRLQVPVSQLLRDFGRDLFAILARAHPQTLNDADSAFALLARLEDHIHPEVKKLYPDAEVPRFEASVTGQVMQLEYRSSRPFADLAEGLILGCATWFEEPIELERTEHADSTRFRLTRHG